MPKSYFDVPSYSERVTPLQNMIADLPKERQKSILENHNVELLALLPSPYYPSLGMEVETFSSRYPERRLPTEKIDRVEQMGLRRDKGDSYPVKGKENKWEVVLEPVVGSQIILMRELQQLHRLGLIDLTSKLDLKDKVSARQYWEMTYYPTHVTVGGVKRDFPSLMARKDVIRFEDDHYTEADLRTSLSDWTEFNEPSKKMEGWQRKHMFSDCFILARLLDSTLYATSPDRLSGPFDNWKDGDEIKGYAQKGFSGVKSRDEDGENAIDAIELRTSELSGDNAFQNMDRFLASAKVIGASLRSFQKLPMNVRDEIINLQIEGNYEDAVNLVNTSPEFDLPCDRDLALQWLDLRTKLIDIFESHGLDNPGHEYWGTEFRKFSALLRLEQIKFENKEPNMISEVRSLVISKKSKITSIIDG